MRIVREFLWDLIACTDRYERDSKCALSNDLIGDMIDFLVVE